MQNLVPVWHVVLLVIAGILWGVVVTILYRNMVDRPRPWVPQEFEGRPTLTANYLAGAYLALAADHDDDDLRMNMRLVATRLDDYYRSIHEPAQGHAVWLGFNDWLTGMPVGKIRFLKQVNAPKKDAVP